MWCGNAAGDCLPPMVVYKAENIYESWVKGGHKGTVYSVPSRDGSTRTHLSSGL